MFFFTAIEKVQVKFIGQIVIGGLVFSKFYIRKKARKEIGMWLAANGCITVNWVRNIYYKSQCCHPTVEILFLRTVFKWIE